MSFNDKIMVVIDASSSGAVKEMDRLQRSTKEADKGVAALGKTLKTGLVAGAAAFAGAGIVSFLNDSVTAYSDAAKKAGELAKATGGSVANVSRMTAALQDNGVSAEQTAALLSKFTATVGKNDALLGKYGVTLKKNADGSADYADAMVQVIDNISKIGDASQRQAALTEVFGKKQAAVFQELAASGVSLSDAMAAVSKYRVFSGDDVARAVAYDDAMDKLGGSVQGLQFALGEALVPALSVTADALAEVVEFMSGIPVGVYAAVGGFVALKGAMSFFGPALSKTVSDVALALTGLGAAGGPGGLAKTLGSGLVSAIGPANLALAGLAAAYSLVEASSANTRDEIDQFLPRLKELEDAGSSSADALRQTAAEWEKSASFWDKFGLAMSDSKWNWLAPNRWTNSLMEAFKGGGMDLDNFKKKLEESRDEMGESAYQAGIAEAAQRELNDIIATGEQRQGELKDAVMAAGAAQAEQNANTDEARALMDAYAASTYGAVSATMAYFDAAYAAEDAQKKLNDAIAAYNENPTADNSAAVLQAARDNAAAATRAWETAQVAAGVAVTQMARDAQYLSSLKIQLQQPGLPPDAAAKLQAEIDGVTAAILRQGGFNIPVGVQMTPEEIQAALDRAKQGLEDAKNRGDLNAQTKLTADITAYETTLANIKNGVPPSTSVTVTADTGTAKTDIDGVATDRTAKVTVTQEFAGGGYEGAKARVDYLAQERNGSINIAHSFNPDGYNALKARSDYLAQNRTGNIGINVNFSPDGYNALKARKDYLVQDRTSTITFRTVGLEAARAAAQSIQQNSLGAAAGQAAASANMMFSPINMVRVSLDGRELRSVIDDEIRALTPTTQEVA